MRRNWFGSLLISLFVSKGVADEIRFSSSVLLASPAMPISDFDSSWENPAKGDYAQGRARLSMEYQFRPALTLGVQKRWDYVSNFNHDTARFYSALENNQVANGQYNLDLSINGLRSTSLYLQYFIPLSSGLDIYFTSHVIRGERVQKASLKGDGEVSTDQLEYTWDFAYGYDENRLFDGARYSPKGWGHSFDLEIEAKVDSNNTLNIKLEDVFYKVYWQKLKQDEGCLNRPLTFNCSVITKEGQFIQNLPFTASLNWNHQLAEHLSSSLSIRYWADYRALALGLRSQALSVAYDLVNETYNLGYESRYLKVKWGFDNYKYERASQWHMTFDMNWPIL